MSQETANRKAPTSPHLQIYRWNICSLTSIMHRLTGVMLYVSIVAISWYIVFYTYQMDIGSATEDCNTCAANNIMDYIFAIAGITLTLALYYHCLNGIRHLFWDLGKGFEKKTAQANGVLIIALSVLFTALTIGSVLYFKLF